jgi:hypothetical protein
MVGSSGQRGTKEMAGAEWSPEKGRLWPVAKSGLAML